MGVDNSLRNRETKAASIAPQSARPLPVPIEHTALVLVAQTRSSIGNGKREVAVAELHSHGNTTASRRKLDCVSQKVG
ncbi:MAG: hypothetical protein ABI310_04045, partial [Microbacteriaceae bacterium]